jgi:hypothetical protein
MVIDFADGPEYTLKRGNQTPVDGKSSLAVCIAKANLRVD